MTSVVGCPFFLAGFACLFIGLILGMRSIFVIRQSQGRLRGYGYGIVSAVISGTGLLGIAALVFLGSRMSRVTIDSHDGRPVPSERRNGPKLSGPYAALVSSPPPANWVDRAHSSRTLRGPAAAGAEPLAPEDAVELNRIIERAAYEGFEARRVIGLTFRHHRDKATDATIVIWFALLNTNLEPIESRVSWNRSDGSLVKWGQILVGIYTESPPEGAACVKRLAEHYEQRLAEIELE